MRLKPIGNRVLLEVLYSQEKTVGGIYIPPTAQEKTQEGLVREVGTCYSSDVSEYDSCSDSQEASSCSTADVSKDDSCCHSQEKSSCSPGGSESHGGHHDSHQDDHHHHEDDHHHHEHFERADVKVGDRVIYDKYAGSQVKVDGKDYLVIKVEDIIAKYV